MLLTAGHAPHVRFHPSEEVSKVRTQKGAQKNDDCFHPSEEVSKGRSRQYSRTSHAGFHPSEEVSKALRYDHVTRTGRLFPSLRGSFESPLRPPAEWPRLRVSIPQRKFRKPRPTRPNSQREPVSIPQRKFRKGAPWTSPPSSRRVSIPQRKFRKGVVVCSPCR